MRLLILITFSISLISCQTMQGEEKITHTSHRIIKIKTKLLNADDNEQQKLSKVFQK